MSGPRQMPTWSESAVRHLLDVTTCPVCGAAALYHQRCRACGADYSGPIGAELWSASEAAAAALQTRQLVLSRVPLAPRRVPVETAAPTVTTPVAVIAALEPRSSATVQSVLAVAGAGLFAVAAIVFTFFNPDLTDHVLRGVIVAAITVVFLGGAWLLARHGLQFSAEAVGALGMVFVGLDVYALTELPLAGVSPWVPAAIGTLVGGAAMVAASALAGIRTWLWISLVALATVPAMLGYAGDTSGWAIAGHLGTMLAAIGLIELTYSLAPRYAGTLRAERLALTVMQLLAVAIVAVQLLALRAPAAERWLTVAAALAVVAVLAAVATRRLARGTWSFIAGAAGIAAVASLPLALDLEDEGRFEWAWALIPAAAAVALVALGALLPLPSTIARRRSTVGALVVAGIAVVPAAMISLATGGLTALGALVGERITDDVTQNSSVLAGALGVLSMALGLGVFAWAAGRRNADERMTARVTGSLAIWLAALSALAFACLPILPAWGQVTIALGLAGAASALLVLPPMRTAATSLRLPVIVGAHLAVLLAGLVSWTDETIVVWAGIAVVAAIAAVAAAMPPRARFLYVGIGYAYALVVFATALDLLGVGTIALLCLTTSLGSIGAMVATFLPRLKAPSWHAILVVTAVPFVIGVIQVVFERSGWTALSTGLIFLLALTLLVTRRAGLGVVVRTAAAGLLVPSLAVVVVCLGAQVLLGSASPVTLPVIAVIVALVLPSTLLVRAALERRGIRPRDAGIARVAIEASALLTGAIAVGLALVREAAGLSTSFLVLVILGIGAAATSVWAGRRYGWWIAAACFTGALWCVWALAGIDVLEPYLLPPALGAALVGAILTARESGNPTTRDGVAAGSRRATGLPLYATGLALAVVPILVVLAVTGNGVGAMAAWRGYGLIAAAWMLLALGLSLGGDASSRTTGLRALRAPTFATAIVVGAAGAIQGARFGLGLDSVVTGGVPLVLLCLGVGLLGALPAAAAARAIRSGVEAASRLGRTRWLYAPAGLYVAVAAWPAIERDWFTIWAMWSLMLAYLVAMVVVSWRAVAAARPATTARTGLPPVWFLFAISFVTAVVAWSPRDLRVEWFSLPLGVFLLAAGAVAMRRPVPASANATQEENPAVPSFDSWPARWTGSWALLAPGLVVMMLASIVATFTDPLTWRAILVIVIALVAILVGSSRKLAAPFLIGIIVLPIENVFVFMVQIGRGIESVPWWITLAVVGAVLLIIAVTYERRAGEDSGIAARLRDLA